MAKKKVTTVTTTTTEEIVETKPLKTYIAIVLDESGSMCSCVSATISAFNEQIGVIKGGTKEGMETLVTLTKFSTGVRNEFVNQPVSSLVPINELSYRPSGMTAMYDGIGSAIDMLKVMPDANDSNTSFLVVVISDGEENSSREYTHSRVSQLLEEVQKTGRWTITYLGSNQDLKKIQTMGIPKGNIQAWNSTNDETAKSTYSAQTIGTYSYMNMRCSGVASVDNFYGGKDNGKD